MRQGFSAIFAYWRAERRTIGVGFVALVVASTGNLVAGLTLGSITGTLEALPGLIVLVPAAIDMRGNIFGALGSRLGTHIHSGLFEVSRSREGVMGQNLLATTALTLGTSLALAILARGLTMALGFEGISLVDLVVISMVGGVLSSIWLGGITVAVSIQAHRRGWDMDSVAAPW
jgi:mgtE-like transporter